MSNAFTRFSGNGTTTQFIYTFTQFEDNDVFVYLFDTTSGEYVAKTVTTDYTISGSTITFNTAPPTGTDNVLIVRKTDFDNAKVYPFNSGSSIRAEDLNKNFLQSVRADQEFRDLKVHICTLCLGRS